MVKYYKQLKNKKLFDEPHKIAVVMFIKKGGECLHLTIIVQNDDAN